MAPQPEAIGDKGIYMVEFLTTFTVLALVIPSFLAVIYLGVARVSIKFILKQAGVCLSYEKSISTCRTKTKRLSQRLLPLGRIQTLRLNRSEGLATVSLDYSLADKFYLSDHYTINLPLKADAL